ncbi:MAG: L,D-transpeptidase family protein [Jannaschia sp.]
MTDAVRTGSEDIVVAPTGLRFLGRRIACTVGRGGIRMDKHEGDGATPVGSHRIVGMLYRPDRMRAPARWARPIGLRDLWCDDPGHAAYNRAVCAPFSGSAEHLRRGDPLYDLILLTGWNETGQPGRGSAIFLHRWRRPGYPTEGCVAMDAMDLRWVAERIRLGTRLVVPERLASDRLDPEQKAGTDLRALGRLLRGQPRRPSDRIPSLPV